MMKSIRIRKILVSAALSIFLQSPMGHAFTPFRVVIDPGHGGSDQGAIYRSGTSSIAEKDVTLILARQVARQLRARGISAILTRSEDKDVALQDRTALANRVGADVFLSIHMNSTPVSALGGAQGVETYILNHETDASSKRLAYLENRLLEPRTAHSPEQTDVALILKDLQLDANLSESKRLACSIQSGLGNASHRDRGVKQALFYVLLGADMPSVLVEAGFLNSPHDRAWVLSSAGQRAISVSIARSIDAFKHGKNTAQALSTLSRCKVN